MMIQQNSALHRSQRGAAVLMVSVIMLIAVTLVVFFTAQSVVMEQRVSANETRALQAQEAAFAGQSYALGYFSENKADADGDDVIDVLLSYPAWTYVSGSSGPSYRVQFVDDFGSDSLMTVISEGRSDDASAVKTLTEVITSTPATADPPDKPLTARGIVDIQGSGTITNAEGALTIWSGRNVDVTGNSTKTIIQHPSGVGVIESTNMNNKGLDIIDNDTSLSTLTDDDYFRNFFGLTPTQYRASVPSTVLDAATTSVTTLDGLTDQVIWVDGDGSGLARFTSNTTMGTADDPVVVIINGDMEAAGTVTVYGMLFVTGDLAATGNTLVHGAAVVRGDVVNASGSLDIFYSSTTLGNLNSAGRGVGMPGTWKDW